MVGGSERCLVLPGADQDAEVRTRRPVRGWGTTRGEFGHGEQWNVHRRGVKCGGLSRTIGGSFAWLRRQRRVTLHLALTRPLRLAEGGISGGFFVAGRPLSGGVVLLTAAALMAVRRRRIAVSCCASATARQAKNPAPAPGADGRHPSQQGEQSEHESYALSGSTGEAKHAFPRRAKR